jgi:hypothetical protein
VNFTEIDNPNCRYCTREPDGELFCTEDCLVSFVELNENSVDPHMYEDMMGMRVYMLTVFYICYSNMSTLIASCSNLQSFPSI